jgi:DNA-binding NarL/FixJ family response regulator
VGELVQLPAELLAQVVTEFVSLCPQLLDFLSGQRQVGAQAFQHGAGLSVAKTIACALNETSGPEPRPDGAEAILTRREWEVAELVAQGLTNKEIAARLVIAQRTAEAHVERILAKLGLASRTQLATWIPQRRRA